uniref:kazal-type serine protease inhibitor domain-containing protein 1 n=1 Tax=Myxine glutinosa TaxID=7769 RepID=UPI00358F7248
MVQVIPRRVSAYRFYFLLLLADNVAVQSWQDLRLRRLYLSQAADVGCGTCELNLCQPPRGCTAGTVVDRCGCCMECGNVQGQPCDPRPHHVGPSYRLYGSCGRGLACLRYPARDGRQRLREEEEYDCACVDGAGTVCGSDGRTYESKCRLREEALTRGRPTGVRITVRHEGPCRAVPTVVSPPRDARTASGTSVMLRCEAFAFPLARLTWFHLRTSASEFELPGDDARISVQIRGGPGRYRVSGWLRIDPLHISDVGTYVCEASNVLGKTRARALLSLINHDEDGDDDGDGDGDDNDGPWVAGSAYAELYDYF